MKKQDVKGKWRTYPYYKFHVDVYADPNILTNYRTYDMTELEDNKGYVGWRKLSEEEIKAFKDGDCFINQEYNDELEYPHERPNLKCDCGSITFGVCMWEYPYTGAFIKVVCSECGQELILINDYA